jgi:hypothetical protein
MRGVRGVWIGPNFTIFLFFLAVALLEALERRWLVALLWLACGLMFLWVDLRNGGFKPR